MGQDGNKMKMKCVAGLTFVEKYNYPIQIREHFEEILSNINESKVQSVILSGSTSRGELSYQTINERIVLYSDYEFLVISKGSVDPLESERLAKVYRTIEERHSTNYLFHIDFSYIDVRRLRSLPPHLKHYETKENGITIYGRDMLHLVPDITLKNLDFKDLNEILIWRLWAILLYLPNELVRSGSVDDEQESMYMYVLYRNLLDLTTWILPLKGVLLPSFRKRHAWLESNFSTLQDNQVVDKRFLSLMNECMIGKFELRFNRPLVDLYTTTIEYFVRAKQHLLNVNHTVDYNNVGSGSTIEKRSSRFFHDYHYRRKGYEILFLLNNFRNMGIRQGIRWVLMCAIFIWHWF
jgi:hypothetical protein